MQKYKEKMREKFLTDDEFHRLGQVMNEIEADGSETLSALTAIRLLMLTGCRLNEFQTLRWENVNLKVPSCAFQIPRLARGWFLSAARPSAYLPLSHVQTTILGHRRQEA